MLASLSAEMKLLSDSISDNGFANPESESTLSYVVSHSYNGESVNGYIYVRLDMHEPCGSTPAWSFFRELFLGSI